MAIVCPPNGGFDIYPSPMSAIGELFGCLQSAKCKTNLPRLNRHLQHPIALIREQVVGFHDVVEFVVVRHHHAQV